MKYVNVSLRAIIVFFFVMLSSDQVIVNHVFLWQMLQLPPGRPVKDAIDIELDKMRQRNSQ